LTSADLVRREGVEDGTPELCIAAHYREVAQRRIRAPCGLALCCSEGEVHDDRIQDFFLAQQASAESSVECPLPALVTIVVTGTPAAFRRCIVRASISGGKSLYSTRQFPPVSLAEHDEEPNPFALMLGQEH
jgi:hypothetical protein